MNVYGIFLENKINILRILLIYQSTNNRSRWGAINQYGWNFDSENIVRIMFFIFIGKIETPSKYALGTYNVLIS